MSLQPTNVTATFIVLCEVAQTRAEELQKIEEKHLVYRLDDSNKCKSSLRVFFGIYSTTGQTHIDQFYTKRNCLIKESFEAHFGKNVEQWPDETFSLAIGCLVF